MRPFFILICFFLVLNVTFTATAVSISDGAIVPNYATSEGPDGHKNGLNVTQPYDIEDYFCQLKETEDENMLKVEAAVTLSPGGG